MAELSVPGIEFEITADGSAAIEELEKTADAAEKVADAAEDLGSGADGLEQLGSAAQEAGNDMQTAAALKSLTRGKSGRVFRDLYISYGCDTIIIYFGQGGKRDGSSSRYASETEYKSIFRALVDARILCRKRTSRVRLKGNVCSSLGERHQRTKSRRL